MSFPRGSFFWLSTCCRPSHCPQVIIIGPRSVIQAYPASTKGSEFDSLRKFVGPTLGKNPDIIIKSDEAEEIIKAVRDLRWLPSASLLRRWPHNSVLEREMRSFVETGRAVHLQQALPSDRKCGLCHASMPPLISVD